jgi:hypothetical protein
MLRLVGAVLYSCVIMSRSYMLRALKFHSRSALLMLRYRRGLGSHCACAPKFIPIVFDSDMRFQVVRKSNESRPHIRTEGTYLSHDLQQF